MTMSSSALRVECTQESISIFRADEKNPLLVQHANGGKRPYIHPIVAPDGRGILTENAPPHHPWQHGLYVGLNDINGIGFWEEGLRGNENDGSFHPRPLKEPLVDNNRVDWYVETLWKDPGRRNMICEMQKWTFTDLGSIFELDLDWSLMAEIDLTFGQHSYGGLFLRMPFKKEIGGVAFNSEGQLNQEAEGKKARYVVVSMPIEGRTDTAGVAMMDHVDNPEHPVPWRVDGQLGICPSRCVAGPWTLKKGNIQQFKHRLYISCGSSSLDVIEQSWNTFNGR